MIYFKDFICCFGATFGFCMLMRSPRRAVIFTSIMAACSWMIYDLILFQFGSDLAGYFFANLFVAFFSEIGARRFRMPAIIFLFPALIPYVPGVGIYQAMLHMVEGDMVKFSEAGMHTLLIAGCIAAAVALINIFFSSGTLKKVARKREHISNPS